MNHNLIPITLFITTTAMVFGIFYLRTRENLAILEKGRDPRAPRPYNSLRTALLFIGAGLGLLIAYLLDNYMVLKNDPAGLYFALIALGGGAGLLGSYSMEKKAMEKHPDMFR